jgi:hypothetical protein
VQHKAKNRKAALQKQMFAGASFATWFSLRGDLVFDDRLLLSLFVRIGKFDKNPTTEDGEPWIGVDA